MGDYRIMRCLWGLAVLVLLAGCAAPQGPSPYGPGPNDPRADSILIEKSKRRMTLYRHGLPWKSYRIALGQGGLEPKRQEGDNLTPEGLYYIENRNPQSIFYRSLRISYPNEEDMRRAMLAGVQPGSHIMIHGLSNETRRKGRNHIKRDWTHGCIAVTDREIEEVWNSVADGTPVEIIR